MKFDGLTLARALKTLRTRVGWTQKDLADKAGVSKASISSYESQRRVPTLETATRIADALDASLDDLMRV